jgi:hypothetical protein
VSAMKRPTQRGVVPPGGYCRYVDPDAGFECKHPYYDTVKTQARLGRVKHGLPIPFDWDAWFDNEYCKSTPTACVDVGEVPVETAPNWVTLALQFGHSMVGWAMSGFKVVTWEEFKERYSTCTGNDTKPRCPQFTNFKAFGIPRCGACGCSSIKLAIRNAVCPKGKWK